MTTAKTPKRTRKGTNLYLPKALVVWATGYAKNKHDVSLSKYIERRLLKLKSDADRAA